MNTNFLRFLLIVWWMSCGLHAVAQQDSLFVQGYISNVIDKDLNIVLAEDMGTSSVLKYDAGKKDGHSQDGLLDFVYVQRKSGTHYYTIYFNMEENWDLCYRDSSFLCLFWWSVSFPLKFQTDFIYYIFIAERIKVFVGIVHTVANFGCVENIQGSKRGYVQAFG